MPALEAVPNGTSEPSSSTIGSIAGDAAEHAQSVLDTLSSPGRRTEIITQIQAWAIAHPKLAAFIALNLALTGGPIILFTVFILSVGFFSLVVGLLLTLAGCVIFTLTCGGFALTILLPTILFTTTAACTIFFWALVAYHLLGLIGGAGSGESQPNDPELQPIATSRIYGPTEDRVLGFDGFPRGEKLHDDAIQVSSKSVAI